jgi:uncharacterized repeat protein (TIGR03803 family)
LIRDAKGNLYGTTSGGGGTGCHSSHGCGTVFKLHPTGKETVLHRFAGPDGANPFSGVIMDTTCNLYGVTAGGGDLNCGGGYGCGVVYKLSKSGKFTVLHSFAGGATDGCSPFGTPAMDSNGNLYGTAWECGPLGVGIVWKLSNTGTETVLHNFSYGPSDGAYPGSGVLLDASGNLYGNTWEGGASGVGTVYKLDTSGTLTLLHSFAGPEGSSPVGGLIQDAQGNFYGTAEYGGSGVCNGGCGTVWKLTP